MLYTKSTLLMQQDIPIAGIDTTDKKMLRGSKPQLTMPLSAAQT